MLDVAPSPVMQRARGRAHVAFALRKGTSLADLAQAGSAKVLLPRVQGDRPECVFLNTSGGLTGGDVLDFSLDLAPGTRLSATTQTAERAYQSRHGAATVRVTARVGQGASLHWLPQETILFQDSHLDRETAIDLDAGAEALVCESLVLGRHAMGETLTRARLSDRRMVRRAGRPVWAEGFLLSPGSLAHPGLLQGARALGVVALIAQGAEDAAHGLPRTPGARVEVSAWDGRCLVRIAADSGLSLRRQIGAIVQNLSARALPRVWASGGLP